MHYIVLCSFFSLFFCCKSQKDTSVHQKLSDSTLKETISFFSIGEGINRNALEEFEKFMEVTNQKYNQTLFSEKKHWGREGEINIDIYIGFLKNKDRDKLLEQIKEFCKKNNLVRLLEPLEKN